uniref:Uncharacterized protein n=1 Tax=Arundo donax TaxID=35708 RepID=A0A0A8ZM88_ARUDO
MIHIQQKRELVADLHPPIAYAERCVTSNKNLVVIPFLE